MNDKEGNLSPGDLSQDNVPPLSPQQLEANKALVLRRFADRFGLDDANITNPHQRSPQDAAAHGF